MDSSTFESKTDDDELSRIEELADLGARRVYNMSLNDMAKILRSAGKSITQDEFNNLVVLGFAVEKSDSNTSSAEQS